jgi:hypothetical protein
MTVLVIIDFCYFSLKLFFCCCCCQAFLDSAIS